MIECDAPVGHFPDWGNVPTWVGATLTSGSVFLAYRSVRRTERRNTRDQASKVNIVITRRTRATTRRVFEVEIEVQNNSDLPIYAVRTGLLLSTDRERWAWLRAIDPKQRGKHTVKFDESSPQEDPLAWAVGVAMFRDAAGYWWERTSEGGLEYPLRVVVVPRGNRGKVILEQAKSRARRLFPLSDRARRKTPTHHAWGGEIAPEPS